MRQRGLSAPPGVGLRRGAHWQKSSIRGSHLNWVGKWKKKKGAQAPGCCFWMVSSKLFSSHSYCSPPDYPSCEILYHLMWMLLGTWHLLICFIQLLPGHPALYLLCKFCLGKTTSSPSCKIIEVLPTSYSSLLENTHWELSKYFLASKLEWTFPENTDGFQVWSI